MKNKKIKYISKKNIILNMLDNNSKNILHKIKNKINDNNKKNNNK